jgi:hypothetical protein
MPYSVSAQRKFWYASVACMIVALIAASRVFVRAEPGTISLVETILALIPGILIPGILYLLQTNQVGFALLIWIGLIVGLCLLVLLLGLWLRDGFFFLIFAVEVPILALITYAILHAEDDGPR